MTVKRFTIPRTAHCEIGALTPGPRTRAIPTHPARVRAQPQGDT